MKAISLVSDGESTCSPHIYDFILRGRANGLNMALGTNGYLLKHEKLADILPALTYLRFNISAAEPKKYSKVMGCPQTCFSKVEKIIKECVRIKKAKNLPITIGLQMVLLPEYQDQVIPLVKLGKRWNVDYTVIKHCSDDESGSLGVDYSKYFGLSNILKEAENYSDGSYLVKVKWSKILSGGKREYAHCYAPPFIVKFRVPKSP